MKRDGATCACIDLLVEDAQHSQADVATIVAHYLFEDGRAFVEVHLLGPSLHQNWDTIQCAVACKNTWR